MTVVFYISGHGFGHASRQVEVINALGALRPDLDVEIRSSVSPHLLGRTLTVPYTLVPTTTDAGIVQRDSVTHDDPATLAAATAFYGAYGEHVAREIATLPAAVAAIVGDIPPLAFSVAAARGVPSMAIANFTWDWIYETHPGFDQAPWIAARAREAYATAGLALELPFSGGFEVFPRREPIPLIARHATRSREETRRFFGLPAAKPLALLSFGGYGLPALDLTAIDALVSCAPRIGTSSGRGIPAGGVAPPSNTRGILGRRALPAGRRAPEAVYRPVVRRTLGDWGIVTTDRVSEDAAGHPDVTRIVETRFVGSGFRYEDLVAAVDVVVTKPGYGIIAECAAAGTAMLYTSRGEFREYDVLVSALPRYVRSRFISQTELFAGRWRDALAALLEQPPAPERLATDGAEVAARRVSELAS